MAGVLTVDGVAYDQASRAAGNLLVDGFGWGLDSDSWLEFHEHHAGPQPRFKGDLDVSYVDKDGTLRFTGTLTSARPSRGADGTQHAYRCQGFRYRLDLEPFRGRDGTASAEYCLTPLDLGYVPALAGKSIGWILADLLDVNAAALAARGVTRDATTADQLAALTFVPPNPLRLAGERLGSTLADLLQSNLPGKRLWFTVDGALRIADVNEGASITLTQGVDPIEPTTWSRSWSDSASRVVVLGGPDVDGFHALQSAGALTPAWTAPQEDDWTWAAFEAPGDATDTGTVVSIDGPQQITVSSDRAWALVNYWSDRQARVYLTSTSATGLSYTESRPVTASAVKAAGGSATLTLAFPLSNSAAGAYDSFALVGTVAPIGGGLSNVHRLFAVTTPGGWVESHLVPSFPVPFAFFWLGQSAVELTSSPSAMLFGPSSGITANFTIDPSNGTILFDRPVVERFNEKTALDAGGSGLVKPDVLALVAYSRGPLAVAYPPDVDGAPVHSGGANAWAGIERTRYVTLPGWTYAGNSGLAANLAQLIHESISDVTIEGDVSYYGAWTDVWTRGDGFRLSIASNLGTTGDEATAAPVRSVDVRIVTDGGGLLYATRARVSNRRDVRTATAAYEHLSTLGSGAADADAATFAAGPVVTGAQPWNAWEGGGGFEDPDAALASALGLDRAAPGANTSGKYKRGRKYSTPRPYSYKKRKVRASKPYKTNAEKRKKKERADARARRRRDADRRVKLGASRRDAIRPGSRGSASFVGPPEPKKPTWQVADERERNLEDARSAGGFKSVGERLKGLATSATRSLLGPIFKAADLDSGREDAARIAADRKNREDFERHAIAGRNARRKIESEDAP